MKQWARRARASFSALFLLFGAVAGACGSDSSAPASDVGGTGGAASTCASCPGCCAGTTCVALSQQDATTCGTNGATCAGCGVGFKCEKGSCVVDPSVCSAVSCGDGCCSENVCVKGAQQSWAACGSSGAKCGTCATGVACAAGVCDPAHWSALATFTLRAVEIANCSCTDPVGLPDPYVTLSGPSGSGSTNHCADTNGCMFSSGSIKVTASDLVAGSVTFHIYDEDTVSDDDCGGATIKLPSPIPVSATYSADVGAEKFTFALDPM